MKPIAIIGLDEPEYVLLRKRLEGVPVVWHPSLPEWRVENGELSIESRTHGGRFVVVSGVVYHAIFDHDFDFLSALALWGGPCLPGAMGLMDCRLRLPCLARASAVSRYGRAPRGVITRGQTVRVTSPTVAKWGNRHCGENKVLVHDAFSAEEPTVLEPFFEGEAVRVVLVGDMALQIRLAGDDWLKSIHHAAARVMEQDERLVVDTRRLADHFKLEMVGVDYLVDVEGEPHLLEVNHVPNITVFPQIRDAFLALAAEWVGRLA